MRIFLYEHVTAGGCLLSDHDDSLPGSLLREGRAMVETVAADLAAIQSVSVTLMCDQRFPVNAADCRIVQVRTHDERQATFKRLAADADVVLVIAPECDDALHSTCRQVELCGGRLLGPGLPVVKLCSDKHATAEHLAAAGVPVPRGITVDAGQALPTEFAYPAVTKPRDGCGSQDVRLIANAADAALFGTSRWPARLECFCPGVAASVAVLCGPKELRALIPCRQRLSDDGRFQYLGGAIPLPPKLARRATELAIRAVQTLPEPRGYVGVDLVLHDRGGQSHFADAKLGRSPDFVIEINPRLTTSYVGLRAACSGNLAEAMLRIAAGEPAELSFRHEPLQFDPDGTVHFIQGNP